MDEFRSDGTARLETRGGSHGLEVIEEGTYSFDGHALTLNMTRVISAKTATRTFSDWKPERISTPDVKLAGDTMTLQPGVVLKRTESG